MSSWSGANAIVTGAASGIGFALSSAMVARGANVWLTDVNPAAVQDAAGKLGDRAHWAELDVRDASAVRDRIGSVAADHGHLDLLFNNAGIGGAAGEAHDLEAGHYDHIIDINVRGVTNGVAAAYPLMVEQGHGHIVNTASVAGLLPVPLLTPYAMTKHAVVGLSASLRLEAASYGVRVSALCPAAIETPLLDSEGPAGLPRPWRPDLRRYLTSLAGAPYPVAKLADDALLGVERNRGLIIVPTAARVGAFLNRLLPGLVARQTARALATELEGRPAKRS